MGETLLEFDSLYNSGYVLGANETFIGLSSAAVNNSYTAIKFKKMDFSNEVPTKMINKANYSNMNNFIKQGMYGKRSDSTRRN
jgi:hypothetical protein